MSREIIMEMALTKDKITLINSNNLILIKALLANKISIRIKLFNHNYNLKLRLRIYFNRIRQHNNNYQYKMFNLIKISLKNCLDNLHLLRKRMQIK